MIKDLRLTFSSIIPIFETWLERFRLKTLPRYWKSCQETEFYLLSRPTFRREELGIRQHEFELGVIRPVADRPDQVELLVKGTAIVLRLLEISPGRLQLQMDCLVWLAVSYCLDLLDELHRTWPETSPQVDPYQTLFLLEIAPFKDSLLLFGESLIQPSMMGVCIKRELWMRLIYGPPARVIDRRSAHKARGAAAPNPTRQLARRPALPASPKRPEPQPRRRLHQTPRQQWQKSSERSKRYIRLAWKIHLQMQEEYRQDVLDGASQRAKPTIQDFHDRVLAEMSWNVGIRRLQEVIAMGEAGVIE